MVADTQETMTKMFDNMNDTFKATMNAFGRMQEAWTKPFVNPDNNATGSTAMNFAPLGCENVAKNLVPFVEKSFENFTETCNATFDTGLQAAKSAVTATPTNADADFAKGTQKAFDATMTAFGTNMGTLTKAFARNTENCTKLMQSVWSDATKVCGTNGCETKGSESRGTGSKGSGKTTNK